MELADVGKTHRVFMPFGGFVRREHDTMFVGPMMPLNTVCVIAGGVDQEIDQLLSEAGTLEINTALSRQPRRSAELVSL